MDGRLHSPAECGPSSLAMQAAAAGGPASYDGQGRLIWGSFTNFYQRWGPDLSKGPSGPLESPNAERRSGGKRRRREGVVPMMRSRDRDQSLSSRGGVEKGSRGREDNDRSTGRETPGDEVQGREEDGNSIENMLGGARRSSPTDSSSGNSSGAGCQKRSRHAEKKGSHTATQAKEDAAGQGGPQDASPSKPPQTAGDPSIAGKSSPGAQKLQEVATSQKLRDTVRKDQVWADMLLQELNDSAARAEQRGGDKEDPGPEAGAPVASFQFIKAAAETPFQRVSRFESPERSARSGHSQGRYGEPGRASGALRRGRGETSWSLGRRNWSGGRSSERQSSNASCGVQRGPGEEQSQKEPSSARNGDARPARAASPLGDARSRAASSAGACPAAAGPHTVDEKTAREAEDAFPDLNTEPRADEGPGEGGQQRADLSSVQEPSACPAPVHTSRPARQGHGSSHPSLSTAAEAEAKRPSDEPSSGVPPNQGPSVPGTEGEGQPSPLSAREAWTSGCFLGASQPLPFPRSSAETPRQRPGVPAPKKRMRLSNPLPFPWLPHPAHPQQGPAERPFFHQPRESPSAQHTAAQHQQAPDGPLRERWSQPAPQSTQEGGQASSFPGFAPRPSARKVQESDVFPGDSFFGTGPRSQPAPAPEPGPGSSVRQTGPESRAAAASPGSAARAPDARGAGQNGRGTFGPQGSAFSGKRRCHSENGDVLLQYVLEGCGRNVEELHQGKWHVNEAFVARISDLFATKREQEGDEKLQHAGTSGAAPEKDGHEEAAPRTGEEAGVGEGPKAGARGQEDQKGAPQQKGKSAEGAQPKPGSPSQQAPHPSAAGPGAPGSSKGAYPLFGTDGEASKGKRKHSECSGRSGRSGRSGKSGGSSLEQGLGKWDKMSDSVRVATQQLLELQRWDGLTCQTAVYWTMWLLRRTRDLPAARVPRALSLLLFTSLHCALPRVLASLRKPVSERDEVQVTSAGKLVEAIQKSRRLFSVMRWEMLQEQLDKCNAALGHTPGSGQAGIAAGGGLFSEGAAKEGGEPGEGAEGERGGREKGGGAKACSSHRGSPDGEPRMFSPACVGRAASLFDLSSGRHHTPEPAPQPPQDQGKAGGSAEAQPQPAPGATATQSNTQGVSPDPNQGRSSAGGPVGATSAPVGASQKQATGNGEGSPSLSFPTFKQSPATHFSATQGHPGVAARQAGQQAGAGRLKRPYAFGVGSGGHFDHSSSGRAGAGSPLGALGGAPGAGVTGLGHPQVASGAETGGTRRAGLGAAEPASSPGAYEAAEADAMSRLSQMFSPYSAVPKRPQHKRAPPAPVQGGAPGAPCPSPGPPSPAGTRAQSGWGFSGFQVGPNRWASGVPPDAAAPGGEGGAGPRDVGLGAFAPRGAQTSHRDGRTQGAPGSQQPAINEEHSGVPQAPMGFCHSGMFRPGLRGGQARAYGGGAGEATAGVRVNRREVGDGGGVDGSTWSRLMGSFSPYGGGRSTKPSAPNWAPKDLRSQVPLGSS